MDERNKTIVKNSLYMYVRMLVLMIISLYTSRVVLQTLGVEDYGIYNIVGGLIIMFTFVSNAMATGTQRHISFEMGKKNGDVSKVFSACFYVHLVIAILVVLLGESLGLWFFRNKLFIPSDRMSVAELVYQIALLSTSISIIKVPFDATITAHEKFNFYAYTSILEGVLKLLVAAVLIFIPLDKLAVYAGLNCFVVIIILLVVTWYVLQKIPNVTFVRIRDKSVYKYIVSFTGWTIFGSLANVVEGQGVNIIINIFYGVALNAAVGIGTQVKSVFQQLTGSLQASLNPQLVKSEAEQNSERQIDLICKSSKFSFIILCVFAIPVVIRLDELLGLWLGNVPSFTSQITILLILFSLIEALSSPLYTTIFAIGDIKKYQLIISLIKISTLVIAYFLAVIGCKPYIVYSAPCLIAVVATYYRLYFLTNKIRNINTVFLKKVLIPLASGVLIGVVPLYIVNRFLFNYGSLVNLLCFLLFSFLYLCIVFFYTSINTSERQSILLMIKGFLNK